LSAVFTLVTPDQNDCGEDGDKRDGEFFHDGRWFGSPYLSVGASLMTNKNLII
jgi:hypothetical protein